MAFDLKIRERIKKILVLNSLTIVLLVVAICAVIIPAVYISQKLSEDRSLPPIDTTSPREQYEIAKLAAEIRQIRSDTSGSLFWLKMLALFVTVGGAVGGYLAGQSHVAKRRIEFENRKNIDSAYQSIVQELSDNSPLLRAAAAVKMGMILRSFPAEWTVDEARREQLAQLTKQVLAASLSIEQDRKVLKTLTIALALHKPWEEDSRATSDQSLTILRANLPFEFCIGDKELRSGSYTVQAFTSRIFGDTLVITGMNSKRVKVRQSDCVRIAEPQEPPKNAKLVFHVYDQRHYFLCEVWAAGERKGWKLPVSIIETSHTDNGLSRDCETVEIVDERKYADVRELDLSGAKAAEAFWARIDFSGSDFYRADLRSASFRSAILNGSQFRDATLRNAVFIEANCRAAGFKAADLSKADLRAADLRWADLRGADLQGADLRRTDLRGAKLLNANFAGAKVHGCKLGGAEIGGSPDAQADNSAKGDGSSMENIYQWLGRETSL